MNDGLMLYTSTNDPVVKAPGSVYIIGQPVHRNMVITTAIAVVFLFHINLILPTGFLEINCNNADKSTEEDYGQFLYLRDLYCQ